MSLVWHSYGSTEATVIRMSLVYCWCHLHVVARHSYVIYMSFICPSNVLVSHSYAFRICSSVIRMPLVSTTSTYEYIVCSSYVLISHSYVTRLYSYINLIPFVYTRMSSILPLVCFRLSSVCQSYVLVYRTHGFLPATLTRYLFSKIIECSEKSNTWMNAKEFENKSIINNYRIQNKWKDYNIFKYSDEYKTSQKQIDCKKPSNTKKINNV